MGETTDTLQNGDCTADEIELLDTLQNMGYELNHAELHSFKNEFDRFLEEDEAAQMDDLNCSFSPSLLLENKNSLENGFERNGLNIDELKLSTALSSHVSGERDFPTDDEFINRDSVSDLIYSGYLLLQRLNDQNAYLSDVIKEIESLLIKSDSRNTASSDVQFYPSSSVSRLDFIAGSKGLSEQPQCSGNCPSKPVAIAEAAIRPVLCPPPGCLPFRHDPVKMLELYKRTWSDNPPPGEKKRLSLRWKVREFMMQREISSMKSTDFNKPRKKNPEWVPHSYL